jgi:hypothetical protein
MTGLALSQNPEDAYAGAEAWVEPGPSGSSGGILDAIMKSGTSVLDTITSPDSVKAALNKFVFGSGQYKIPTGTPGATYALPTQAPGTIFGLPVIYVVGAGVLLLLVLSKKR